MPRGYGPARSDYTEAHSRGWVPYAHTAVPITSPYELEQQRIHDIRSSVHYPCSQFNTPSGPYSAQTALYMAASLTDGAARDVTLREADAKELN